MCIHRYTNGCVLDNGSFTHSCDVITTHYPNAIGWTSKRKNGVKTIFKRK